MRGNTPQDKKANAQGQASILKAVAAAIILLVAAAGCAGQGLGKQTVVVKYYPQCYEPITTLRQEAKEMNANVAKGAVGGAVIGALAGALTGKKENILIGAAAGAIVGAAAGYIATNEVQEKDRATRFATYTKYMDDDYSNLDKAVTSARVTANCYKDAYKKLAADYQAGKVTKPEMLERLQEIRDGSTDAREILAYFKDESAKNMTAFTEVQRQERVRTADKGTNSQVRALNQGVSKNKAKASEADLLDQELGTIIASADQGITNLNAKLRRIIETIKTASLPGQGPLS
jgi:uncharacterized protein YcfJ